MLCIHHHRDYSEIEMADVPFFSSNQTDIGGFVGNNQQTGLWFRFSIDKNITLKRENNKHVICVF